MYLRRQGIPFQGEPGQNGVVNDKDFSLLAACIASGRFCPCGDMDGNGVLDNADLACLYNKITWGFSSCDGMVMCEGSPFATTFSGGTNEGQETASEPITWAALAASGVASSAADCLSQGSPTNEAEVDPCAMALRWIAFEQWVTANPVENFGASSEAYDSWAQLQFGRIVLEGKMP